jgi:hypothetical protein
MHATLPPALSVAREPRKETNLRRKRFCISLDDGSNLSRQTDLRFEKLGDIVSRGSDLPLRSMLDLGKETM